MLRATDEQGKGRRVTVTAPTEPAGAGEQLPESDKAFRVETHGIDFIPLSERWARPRDLAGMWAGASLQVEYFIYGAVLMTFGFTFAQALSLIVIGNLSYVLLGLCSLQGPDSGTTVFGTNRAAYGPNGSRVIAGFNWVTQIGFEIEGLLLIVFASIALCLKGGLNPGTPGKVLLIFGAVGVQFVLPFLGHATILKTLRALIIPFVILFVVILGFSLGHTNLHGWHGGGHLSASWEVYLSGLAFTITLSGLGWTQNGNDYSRYLPPDSSKRSVVGWVFLGTAVPEILVMTLGAVVYTVLTSGQSDLGSANPFVAFLGQRVFPSWFVVVFLLFVIVQLFAVNSLDMYSSGVTLQAIGVRVKRYQAVMVDSVICLGFTFYAVFNTSFSTFLKDFVDIVIIWIAPWMAIFLVDWALRRYRYVPAELQNTARGGLYYRNGGVWWPAMIAQLLGMIAAMAGLNTTFTVPTWVNSIAAATGSDSFVRADFSILMGVVVGGLAYLVLAYKGVRAQADRQDELLAGTDV
jgi:purine-cytosine permease-like protein